MKFSYVSIDKASNLKIKGKIEANSSAQVANYLKVKNQTPIAIKEEQDSLMNLLPTLNKVKASEIVFFTRQLSSMILTGLTLLESLEIIKKQSRNQNFTNLVVDLIASISEGKNFSDALIKHKDTFSNVYIALIKAAESGGLLDKVLVRLADNLEKSEELKKQVRSALFYPMIIVIGVIGVIILMNIVVIPQMAALYANLNIELPLTTQIVLAMSSFVTNFFPLLIIAPIGGYILFEKFRRTEKGIRLIDKVILKTPVMGSIATLSILDEITRTLSLLISAGTSIIEALNITAKVSNNVLYQEAIIRCSSFVEKGVPLSTALENQNIFPLLMVQMTKVGEETGKIDENLAKVAEYLERDLDTKIKTLTTSIEPILIIFLGATVAFLILSVLTPIYSLISQIQ